MSRTVKKARFVVAPDSFKGSLSAKQVASVIADALSDAEVIQCPLADGGEGTADILASHMLDSICLIESTQLIGLNLPEMCSLDVMKRGTSPLGEAILFGLDAGKRDFVIGLGGSATNDCGLGMLMVLGFMALDAEGNPVSPNLEGLLSVHSVDMSELDRRLNESRFTILSDVVSPLCGKNGATAVYGLQKGVRDEDVSSIDAAMARYASLYGKPELMDTPGAGSAGGLGFAILSLGGTIVSGAEYVMEKTGFREMIAGVDWVITGEGRSDAQTLHGKLPMKVAQVTKEAGVKVALLSGSVDGDALAELGQSFDLVISALPENMNAEQAMRQAETLLANAVTEFADNKKGSV